MTMTFGVLSIIMAFEKHLFISYAHLDNEPLTEQQQGWITRFHASLSTLLSMRMGRKAEIWRDTKLRGNDIFADEIVQQFPKTALLVSVLTPRYVESDWCTREVREFIKTTETSGGLVIDNKARVFKVIKSPVDSEARLPPVMKDALGYPFYVCDDEETPLELDPAYGGDLAQKYNLKLAKLAWDVAQLLEKLEAPVRDSTNAVASKPVIYLAECSYESERPGTHWNRIFACTGIPCFRPSALRRQNGLCGVPQQPPLTIEARSTWSALTMAQFPMAPVRSPWPFCRTNSRSSTPERTACSGDLAGRWNRIPVLAAAVVHRRAAARCRSAVRGGPITADIEKLRSTVHAILKNSKCRRLSKRNRQSAPDCAAGICDLR